MSQSFFGRCNFSLSKTVRASRETHKNLDIQQTRREMPIVYTPGVECQYGTFTIKTLLHLIHNHNLPTWVEFTDLVKAFDTSNNALLIANLGKYGATPRLCLAIKRMYKKIVVNIIIGKIETSIEFKLGVKQGDSMAQLLFLFLIMAFAKTLEDEWTALGLSKAQFARKAKSPRSTRKLVNHQPVTFSYGTLFDIFCMLYVYDSDLF